MCPYYKLLCRALGFWGGDERRMGWCKVEDSVGINVANTQIKSKITFDLGEPVRQTDIVCTTCKLLLYRIYAVQPNGNGTKELV